MKKVLLLTIVALLVGLSVNWAISNEKKTEKEKRHQVDTRIDNIQYWVKMAKKGLIPFNQDIKAKQAVYVGSTIKAYSVRYNDSPDVPVTEINSTQSENSIFANPMDGSNVLNSNNSTQNPVGNLYGANDFYSFDVAETWEGEVQGVGGSNSGDPTTAIGRNGRWYVNYIDNPGGQGIAYSDNQGITWARTTIVPNPGSLADKNHMWIDNSATSPYEGNVYVAWTDFGGPHDTEIGVSTSTDHGVTWSAQSVLSTDIHAGSHNQGVNLSTGPNGEVYAVWAIYDSWPSDESAIGMAKSLDGGQTWMPAVRIIENIRGIRTTETTKNMRVNSFPSATVDISSSPNRGTIYVVWANHGVPGQNNGNDIDVYMIKSSDQGDNWSEPLRVNQDAPNLGKEHFFPWITCDPSNGILSTIFYDDRNVSSSDLEVYCANSDDGGDTWEDFKVSDVSFTPQPIPGLAGSYFGDYIGITAQDGTVFPAWTDNRSGSAMTYCSPYETNPLSKPFNLIGEVIFETGNANLIWNYNEAENFDHFNIYRDDSLVGTATDTVYTDLLPDYGFYDYVVTAAYSDTTESSGSGVPLQWGDAHVSVSPDSLFANLVVDSSETQYLQIVNTGQLDLYYNISAFFKETKRETEDYCQAYGGGDEYISHVQFGDIDNVSGSYYYFDYTDQSTTLKVGETDTLTVTNGNGYDADQCGVWIDWDQNGLFDEPMIPINGNPGRGPYTAEISPAIGAKSGSTRMRIRIIYTGNLSPCGSTQYGEVEDYTVNVVSWLDMHPTVDTVSAGDTAMVAVLFNSHDVAPGLYTAEARFASNDPDTTVVSVPLTLRVHQMLVFAHADKEGVCIGDSVTLSSTVFGVADTTVYSWTSIPAGLISSSDSTLVVSPDTATWYYFSVGDTNSILASDSVFVNVYDYPVIVLHADTSVCGSGFLELNAANEGATYNWSTGDTTQTVVTDTTGYGYGFQTLWVGVTSPSGCYASDTVNVEFVDCTGIDELNKNVSATVYPNPSAGVFSISLNSGLQETIEIRIVNSTGQIVYEKNNLSINGATNLKVRLSDKSSGVYQLIIKGEKATITRKIIVK